MAETRTCLTIGDGLYYFELVIRKLLNCPFGGVAKARIFQEDVINELRNLETEIEAARRKKNIGVIGGSTTGIVGGGIAIAGAALVPFTFGTSLGLIIAGAAIGAAGAGVSLGFSIDKNLKDKKKLVILQSALEHFIQFQHDLATAMVTIVVCEQAFAKIKNTGLGDVKLSPQREMNLAITHLLAEVETLNKRDDDNRSLSGKVHDIMRYAQTMTDLFSKMLEPMKPIFTGGDSSWFEKSIECAGQNPFDILASSVPRDRTDVVSTYPTFNSFVKKYLTHNEIDESSSGLPTGIGMDAAGNLVAKGGVAGGRVALRYFTTADNLAQVGGNVLKIAKGVSIAGIVLGALGVAVDIGFLGHAIYDLQKKDVDQLSQSFIDLADVMEEINNISVNL